MERLGPYRVVAPLGEGGMGEVYRAIDERLGRTVAIKLLHARDAASAQMQLRLLREAQAASALDHPGVVTVFDVGVHDHRAYVVMEYVTGERFTDLAGKITTVEALRMCAAAADALAAAHDAGILHRDVKSDNLMRTRDGRVKVLDFGLAKLQDGGAAAMATSHPAISAHPVSADASLDETMRAEDDPGMSAETDATLPATSAITGPELTQAGQLIGTPLYMSPEQARREPVTARSEVYALGVVLYELLTGTVPFRGDDVPTTLDEIRIGALVPPSQRRPSLPRTLDPIVTRAMARDPEARYPDMRALAAAMRALTGDRPSRPWPWIAVGAGALACAAAITVLLTREDTAPATRGAIDGGVQPRLVLDGEPRRLTATEGCEEFPSFADGGRTVIYDGARGRDYVLHAIEVATGKIRTLTDVSGWDYASTLSPDGKQLAFVRNDDAGVGTWVMGYDPPSPPRHVRDGSVKPAWTADGKLWAGSQFEAARIDLATGKIERVLQPETGQKLALLAELPGDRLAVILNETNAQVFLGVAFYEPDGAHRMGFPEVVDEVLTPVPGGILTARMRNETSDLWYVPFEGAATQLAGDLEARKGLAISPAGDWVWSTCEVTVHVSALDVASDGRTELRKVSGGTWTDQSPVAIPGTRSIVLLSDRGGPSGLWVIDRDGVVQPREVPTGGISPNDPAVSPDGTLIAFATPAVGISVFPVDGGAPPRPLTTGGDDVLPVFSADGTEVYYQTVEHDQPAIRVVPVAGGASKLVLEDAAMPEASRDGRWLAYFDVGAELPKLHDLRTGRTRPASKALAPAPYDRIRISPDGQRVAMVVGSNTIVELDLATGKELHRHDAGGDQLTGLTYVGDELITTRAIWEGDLWIARGELVLR